MGGLPEQLFLTGNPSKFLQGHNVFGSDALEALVSNSIDHIPHLFYEAFNFKSIVRNASVKRIDFTKSIQFDSRQQVRSYIKQLSLRSSTRNGRPQQKGWTLAYNAGGNQSGRRWQVYCLQQRR